MFRHPVPIDQGELLLTMSGHLDSQSVFRVRLKSLGVSDAQLSALEGNQVDTLAKLAYISSVQPGVADDMPFLKALAAALNLGGVDELTVGDKAIFRRLWFEASTVAISEIRQKVEKGTDDGPKHMPQAERNDRLKSQQTRLAGIRIEGPLEPSHSLLDLIWSIREDNQLRYVSPEVCTSRQQEVLGVKKENFIKAEANGTLTQVQREVGVQADLSTEYRIKLALTRRALAFDNVGILPFHKLEELHEYLFSLVMKEPLETHFGITVAQVMKADRQLWLRLIELTREGVIPRPDGSLPLETFLPEAKLDPLYNAMLQPLPKAASSGYDKIIKQYNDSGSSSPYNSGNKGQFGSGKGKNGQKGGKGKGKWGKARGKTGGMPEELKGLRSTTSTGKPYCWAFNLTEGCTQAKPGQFCFKGFHGCMKCGDMLHSYQACPKK
jgi:hypothetical protein